MLHKQNFTQLNPNIITAIRWIFLNHSLFEFKQTTEIEPSFSFTFLYQQPNIKAQR
jgi:hypothetical protein